MIYTDIDTLNYIVAAISLGLCNLIAWEPIVGGLVFKSSFFHPVVTSDIPGNPHAFDNSLISCMRTLPEPSNFNVVWTGLLFI